VYGSHNGNGVGKFQAIVEAQPRMGGFLLEKSPLEPSAMDAVPSTDEKGHALLDSDDEKTSLNPCSP
jgi:hypothetical protein